MADLQDWLEQEWREARPVFWVAEHIGDYHSVDGDTKMLDDLKRYSQNIYTYATEASRTYHELYRECCNNPVIRKSPYLLKGNYSVLCDWEKDMLVEVPGKEKSYVIPVGILDTVPVEYHAERNRIRQNIEKKWKQEFHDICDKFVKKLEQAEMNCRNRRIEVNGSCLIGDSTLDSSRSVLRICVLTGIGSLAGMLWMMQLWEDALLRELRNGNIILGGLLLCFFGWSLGRKIRNSVYNNNLSRSLEKQEGELKQYKKELEINSDVNLELSHMVSRSSESIDFSAIDRAVEQAENIIKMETKPAYTETVLGKAKRNLVLFTIALVMIAVVPFVIELKDEITAETTAPYETENTEAEENTSVFDENGFVFSDSDVRYLTEEEVYALRDVGEYDFQTLLGYARNELYARHGFAFNENGQYYPYYMQYEWYQNADHHVVKDSEFNEYERANRDLIVEIERREGYRS